jgi:hypothetical protein
MTKLKNYPGSFVSKLKRSSFQKIDFLFGGVSETLTLTKELKQKNVSFEEISPAGYVVPVV